MDLAAKLQIKPGMQVSILGTGPDRPGLPSLARSTVQPAEAGAVIAFVTRAAEVTEMAAPAIVAARQDKLAWIAYPKAGQLGTDLNRDSLAKAVRELGVQPVRQVALDDVWSALRFRPA